MVANRIELGPVGQHLIAQVKELREARGLSLEGLSREMAKAGRPVRATGLHRLEQGRRRVDVDDLVALASALDVEVSDLLPTPAQAPSVRQLAQQIRRLSGKLAAQT